jgi:general secretion pathway protein H
MTWQGDIVKDVGAGYTLIELLVVIGILGLVAAVATPLASKMVSSASVHTASYNIAQKLRSLQDEAVRTQQVITLGQTTTKLSTTTGKLVFASDTEAVTLTSQISYFPDGTTTGGQIILHGGNKTIELNIAWLTGAVAIGEP